METRAGRDRGGAGACLHHRRAGRWTLHGFRSVGTDPGLLDTRGVANLALKQSNANEQAIKDLESATTEAASSTILFHLAQAYAAAGRRADATQAWRRAKLLGISAEVLHPLERPAYNQMAREFN